MDQRRLVISNRLPCLIKVLAYLHEKSFPHSEIKPSSIIDQTTNIFAGIGGFQRLEPGFLI